MDAPGRPRASIPFPGVAARSRVRAPPLQRGGAVF